jgi:hypothetical protein
MYLLSSQKTAATLSMVVAEAIIEAMTKPFTVKLAHTNIVWRWVWLVAR